MATNKDSPVFKLFYEQLQVYAAGFLELMRIHSQNAPAKPIADQLLVCSPSVLALPVVGTAGFAAGCVALPGSSPIVHHPIGIPVLRPSLIPPPLPLLQQLVASTLLGVAPSQPPQANGTTNSIRGNAAGERAEALALKREKPVTPTYAAEKSAQSSSTPFSIRGLLGVIDDKPKKEGCGAAISAIKRRNADNLYTAEDLQTSDGRCKRRKNSAGSLDIEQELFNASTVPILPSLSTHHHHKHKCNECGKSYATSSNLSRHKQTHRPLTSPYAKKCLYCDRVYVSMPALSMHLLTHQASHKCTICGKLFSRPWLLKGHMRAHTGQRPFGCAACGKAFSDRSNLRAHLNTHSNSKRYECQQCGRSFASVTLLQRHLDEGSAACPPTMCRNALPELVGERTPRGS